MIHMVPYGTSGILINGCARVWLYGMRRPCVHVLALVVAGVHCPKRASVRWEPQPIIQIDLIFFVAHMAPQALVCAGKSPGQQAQRPRKAWFEEVGSWNDCREVMLRWPTVKFKITCLEIFFRNTKTSKGRVDNV